MKVVTKTGLVPVHTKDDKRVFGLPPAEAIKGMADGTLFLVDIPDDVETTEIDGPKKPAVAEAPVVDGVLEIPKDWENLHYARIIVLAKTIVGGELPTDGEKKPAEIARAIVQNELARRAAAAAAETQDGQKPPASTGTDQTPAE